MQEYSIADIAWPGHDQVSDLGVKIDSNFNFVLHTYAVV